MVDTSKRHGQSGPSKKPGLETRPRKAGPSKAARAKAAEAKAQSDAARAKAAAKLGLAKAPPKAAKPAPPKSAPPASTGGDLPSAPSSPGANGAHAPRRAKGTTTKDPSASPRVLEAEFVAGAPDVAKLPAPALAEIAFCGRSNVGKSSLLNAMMQRRSLARTSSTPGCTKQINVFEVKTDDDVTVSFVDLPGYGYAKVSKTEKGGWGPMLEGYLLRRQTLRAAILLIDIRRGLEDDDAMLLEFLARPREVPSNKPVDIVLVATKLDKLPLAKRKIAVAAVEKAAAAKVANVKILGFSAVTGEGRQALWGKIRAAL